MITKVDNSGLTGMIRELSRRLNVPVKKATMVEGGKVLGKCVQFTGSAKTSAYPRKGQSTAAGSGFARSGDSELWVNTTGRGGSPIGQVWLLQPNGKTTKNGKPAKGKYLIAGPAGGPPIINFGKSDGHAFRWPDEMWAMAQSLLHQADPQQKLTKKAQKKIKEIRGRGLAKAAWVQIGIAIGCPVDPAPPGYVLKAVPQDGVPRVSGKGRQVQTPQRFTLELEMRYPLLIGFAKKPNSNLDASDIIQRAAQTRVSAFLINLREGIFKDAKQIGSRYGALFK